MRNKNLNTKSVQSWHELEKKTGRRPLMQIHRQEKGEHFQEHDNPPQKKKKKKGYPAVSASTSCLLQGPFLCHPVGVHRR